MTTRRVKAPAALPQRQKMTSWYLHKGEPSRCVWLLSYRHLRTDASWSCEHPNQDWWLRHSPFSWWVTESYSNGGQIGSLLSCSPSCLAIGWVPGAIHYLQQKRKVAWKTDESLEKLHGCGMKSKDALKAGATIIHLNSTIHNIVWECTDLSHISRTVLRNTKCPWWLTQRFLNSKYRVMRRYSVQIAPPAKISWMKMPGIMPVNKSDWVLF